MTERHPEHHHPGDPAGYDAKSRGPEYRRGFVDGRIAAVANWPTPLAAGHIHPDLLAPNHVADALCNLRDDILGLATSYDCISRDAVLALTRTHIDRAVFGPDHEATS